MKITRPKWQSQGKYGNYYVNHKVTLTKTVPKWVSLGLNDNHLHVMKVCLCKMKCQRWIMCPMIERQSLARGESRSMQYEVSTLNYVPNKLNMYTYVKLIMMYHGIKYTLYLLSLPLILFTFYTYIYLKWRIWLTCTNTRYFHL
jgi:hypothetical protein